MISLIQITSLEKAVSVDHEYFQTFKVFQRKPLAEKGLGLDLKWNILKTGNSK